MPVFLCKSSLSAKLNPYLLTKLRHRRRDQKQTTSVWPRSPRMLQATPPLFRQGGQWAFTVAQVQGTVKYLMQSLARDSSLEAAGCLARRGRA